MSLRAFHVIFISISCFLSLGMAGWGIWRYTQVKDMGHLGFALVGLVLLGGLVAYEKWFLGKDGPLSEKGRG